MNAVIGVVEPDEGDRGQHTGKKVMGPGMIINRGPGAMEERTKICPG